MPSLHLILALHHHQPESPLPSVLTQSYESRYQPFLDLIEARENLPCCLHLSGPLLESLQNLHPDFIHRLRRLVKRGQVEILGGGLYEPLLPLIPHRDRVGQLQACLEYLRDLFDTPIRGAWLVERVWDQSLVSAFAQSGIEYTIVDSGHIDENPPQSESDPKAGRRFGYYLTENEGQLLKVFSASDLIRDGIAFADPEHCLDLLRSLADRSPGSTVVLADDGDKFGGWSNTSGLADRRRWLERFCDMLLAQRDWLELTTLSQAADRSLPLSKIYLSDNSSRWRNAQSDEIYARMLQISQRLAAAEADDGSDPDYLEIARGELYRGQCHDAYLADDSGSPHVRHAVFGHLIAADNALDEAQAITGPRVRAFVGDFNLDARQEVRLENDRLIALVRPAQGGHIDALDLRQQQFNVLATFTPRSPSDQHPRKALVDHFYPVEATLPDLMAGRAMERGDFVLGTHQARIRREEDRVSLIMDRIGRADAHSIRLRKTIVISSGESALQVLYEFENIPVDSCLHFAVEINLAASSPDGCYSNQSGATLGLLDSSLDLAHARGLSVSAPSLEFSVNLAWSVAAGLWCFPIETPLRRESSGALEQMRIRQSTAVIPHWHITPDDDGRWEVTIEWSLDPAHVTLARDASAQRIAAFAPA
jgi:hypothetical protein